MAYGLAAGYTNTLMTGTAGANLTTAGNINVALYGSAATEIVTTTILQTVTNVTLANYNTASGGSVANANHASATVAGTITNYTLDIGTDTVLTAPAASTARDVILMDNTGASPSATTNKVYCYWDLASSVTPDGVGDVTIAWNISGVFAFGSATTGEV
ncbi:MAG: hypothetical protein ACE5EF_00090 [Dehalococcoidia bacterium]